MSKLYGTTGRILRIDLSQERMWTETIDEATLRKYLGGTCLGAKYLYDEVEPKVDWSDIQNHIFIGSGPLGGTRMPGSGTFSIVCKGALNNGVTSTQANGFFGAYLKISGFDGILVQGAATNWQYVYLHDGTAELRNAQHLLGKDTWEIEDLIKKELGYSERGMSVFSIGPAGENLVRFAGVFGDRGHCAAHNGSGAVWGSKKLKAVVVARSGGKVGIAHPLKMAELVKEFNNDWKKSPLYEWGTSIGITINLRLGQLPVKNYTTNLFPECPKFDGHYIRSHFKVKNYPCYACSSHHFELMTVTEGPYSGYFGKEPEYEEWAAWGPQIGQIDPGAAVVLSNEVNRLGFDCNECGWLVGWVMECYEKGLLSSKDLDGLEMTWGNVEATRALFKNIAYRRGFGNVLAEGVKRAAEKVGGEAAKIAIYTMRGNTPRGHDHRAKWWEMLDTCVSESATLQNQLLYLDLTSYGLAVRSDPFSPEQVSTAVGKTTGTLPFVDSLGICYFTCSLKIPALCEALNAVTGWDFSFDEALKVGRRAVNLMRVYNIRAGHTADLEKPSPRYCSTPVDGPAKGKSIRPYLEDMLSNYYSLMGWDPNTGIPKPETLKELGLEHVIRDLK